MSTKFANGYGNYLLLPSRLTKENSPVIWSYEVMKQAEGQLAWYSKTSMGERVALNLAERSPYPEGVKLAIRKQLANASEITLAQMRILLGWAARRSQHTGRL